MNANTVITILNNHEDIRNTWEKLQEHFDNLDWQRSQVFDLEQGVMRDPTNQERQSKFVDITLTPEPPVFYEEKSYITWYRLFRHDVGDTIQTHQDEEDANIFVPPCQYEGGELFINDHEEKINPKEWTAIHIPANTPYRVDPVTTGSRYVIKQYLVSKAKIKNRSDEGFDE